MRIIVSGIPEGGLKQDISIPVTVEDGASPENAHVSMDIYRIGKKVVIRGTVKVSVNLKCSRCLKEFTYPVSVEFSEEYNPADEIRTDHEHELSESELDLSYYDNDEINVTELVKEQVLLAVPIKVLCSESCKGICPKCGRNLNRGVCSCRDDAIDPRLEPLQRLKEAMESRKE